MAWNRKPTLAVPDGRYELRLDTNELFVADFVSNGCTYVESYYDDESAMYKGPATKRRSGKTTMSGTSYTFDSGTSVNGQVGFHYKKGNDSGHSFILYSGTADNNVVPKLFGLMYENNEGLTVESVLNGNALIRWENESSIQALICNGKMVINCIGTGIKDGDDTHDHTIREAYFTNTTKDETDDKHVKQTLVYTHAGEPVHPVAYAITYGDTGIKTSYNIEGKNFSSILDPNYTHPSYTLVSNGVNTKSGLAWMVNPTLRPESNTGNFSIRRNIIYDNSSNIIYSTEHDGDTFIKYNWKDNSYPDVISPK